MTIITWEYWEERASISRAEMSLSGGPHRLECRCRFCRGRVVNYSGFDVLLMETAPLLIIGVRGRSVVVLDFYAVLFTDIVKSDM